jgi:outer membrane protein
MKTIATLILMAVPAMAQGPGKPAESPWTVSVGGGAIYAPAFMGSKDYQLIGVPNIRVNYRDRFFASVEGGIGYNAFRSRGLSLGPIARIQFPRFESGRNPLRIAGRLSTALQGMGDVSATVEMGGFVRYDWRGWNGRFEMRRGLNGHQGAISLLEGGYSGNVGRWFGLNGPPLILSIGPRIQFANATYRQVYFGVTDTQSSRSGLQKYTPSSGFFSGGGLLSYGAGGSLVVPLSRKFSVVVFGGVDRLSGDAADSPLVRQRGSVNQRVVGLTLSYSFGFGKVR